MAREILKAAPNVRFVADEGISQLRPMSIKLGVLAGSRLSAEEIRSMIEQIEEEGLEPIWEYLAPKYGYTTT